MYFFAMILTPQIDPTLSDSYVICARILALPHHYKIELRIDTCWAQRSVDPAEIKEDDDDANDE